MTRYVLVGSGIAALSAAESIRATDPRARIILVSRESHPFYSRPGLAYHLTAELPESRLEIRSAAELRDLRIERIAGSVTRIDTAAHTVLLEDGRRIEYDRLLLAPGAASVDPEFEGADLSGVVRLDGLDDARRIRQLARRGRTAVVIGGGITALELVEAFAASGVRTHYLLRGDRYWSRVLDSGESRVVEARLEAQGVRLHYRAEVARATGSDGRIAQVLTTTGEPISCDVLATATGVRPRTELARASGLNVVRGIVTDEFLRTSAADVFAAGDAAEVHDPATGVALLDTLWATAAAHGRACGSTMAGANTAFLPEPALNVTRLAGVTVTIIGAVEGGGIDDDLVTITRGQSERWRPIEGGWTLRDERGTDRLRLVLRADRIVGAVLMGDQALSGALVRLIRGGAELSGLRELLQKHPDALVPLLLEFHRSWEATHAPAA